MSMIRSTRSMFRYIGLTGVVDAGFKSHGVIVEDGRLGGGAPLNNGLITGHAWWLMADWWTGHFTRMHAGQLIAAQ